MAAKIKKGDKVVVLTGSDKGKTGEVLKVLTAENRVIVQGVKMVKRHTRPSAANQGGIDLAQESRLTRLLPHAVNLARERVSQVEQLARARHADVAQPALFLDLLVDIGRAAMGEQPFLHPGDKHDWVLKALRSMQRHQRSASAAGIYLLAVADESDALQKLGQSAA